jgi:glycerol-3-phosphate dehydrogenase
MGAEVVDHAAGVAGLAARPSTTESLTLHGWDPTSPVHSHLSIYGADRAALAALIAERPGWDRPLHPRLPYLAGEAVWAARHEHARTVEDVLARRTRALFLDARASQEAAPDIAALMAETLGHDAGWQEDQVRRYRELAAGYLLNS